MLHILKFGQFLLVSCRVFKDVSIFSEFWERNLTHRKSHLGPTYKAYIALRWSAGFCMLFPILTAKQYHAAGVRRYLIVGIVSSLLIASGTRMGRGSLLQWSNMSIAANSS